MRKQSQTELMLNFCDKMKSAILTVPNFLQPLGKFFLFLGLQVLQPKFLHFRKKKIFLTIFIFSDVKNCQI